MRKIFRKMVNFLYWLITGKYSNTTVCTVDDFCLKYNSDAYFIHAYKIRKETTTYCGLNVSADLTVEALRNNGFRAGGFGFNSDNELDAVLFKERPSHFIIKAFWVRKEKIAQLAKKYPSCKFIVVCHSKPSFLGSEQNGFNRFTEIAELQREHKNIVVAANNLDMSQAMSRVYGEPVLFLPNVVEAYDRELIVSFVGDVLRVGIFCAIRPMKNIITQALAAIEYCEDNNLDLELHILSGRTEMSGETALKNLRDLFRAIDQRHVLVEHPWLTHEDFTTLVNRMDIGLQVSFTESFNIVTIDLLKAAVPVVTSPAIAWSPEKWMANPDSIRDIKNKMQEWMRLSYQEKEDWLQEGECNLKAYNRVGLKIYESLSNEAKKW